jgi:apolipoprotein D and lipocalin family protein
MQRTRLIVLAAVAAIALAAPSIAPAAQPGPAPEPSKPVDPHRYIGRWYEIARLPNMLQKDCVEPTSEWTPQGGRDFAVVQACRIGSPTGNMKVWRASGHIIDGSQNAKIRVGFFGGLIHQDYWIIDRADDYSWCLMSTPSSKYLWIMARRPSLPPSLRAALVARARSLGYDTSRLVFD